MKQINNYINENTDINEGLLTFLKNVFKKISNWFSDKNDDFDDDYWKRRYFDDDRYLKNDKLSKKRREEINALKNKYVEIIKSHLSTDKHNRKIVTTTVYAANFDQLKVLVDTALYLNIQDLNFISFKNIDDMEGLFDSRKEPWIDISDWDMSKVRYVGGMFKNCKQLSYIGEITDWDIDNIKDLDEMFDNCPKMNRSEDYQDLLDEWDESYRKSSRRNKRKRHSDYDDDDYDG